MRVLVTGASGFLGIKLCEHLRARGHDVTGLRNRFAPEGVVDYHQVDLRSTTAVAAVMDAVRPDAVIHAAAFSDPDVCARQPELAFAVNAGGTANLVSVSPARVIYISTDLVFDGTRGWYDEQAATNPLSVYAQSKLQGEQHVLSAGGLVVRVALLIGRSRGLKPSFLDWMEQRLANSEPLPLFVDQFRTPVYVPVVCKALEKLLQRPQVNGILHLGGEERLSRLEIGERYFRRFPGKQHLVTPVRTQDLQKGAVRGQDCSLSSGKLKTLLEMSTGTVDEAFADLAPIPS